MIKNKKSIKSNKKVNNKNKKTINKNKLILIGILLILTIIPLIIIYNYNKETKEYTIPKVYFEGDISNMLTKEDERKISLKYVSNDINFDTYALIKIQGTSSIAYEKKNYTIKLYEDENYENKNKVDVGWGKQNKYCLKANWIDKTHARNIVTAKLASEVQAKYNLFESTPHNGTIDGYPVEIYINGEFLGLYTWNIPKDAWMFNMDEDNENHIVFANEGWQPASLFKQETTYGDWGLEVGKETQETLDKLNRLIKFVSNSDDKTFKKDFDKYLNFDSTINYLILMEFALLEDNVAKNMLLATYDGKIWYPSLYDLDTSWGTLYDGLTIVDYTRIDNAFQSKLWTRMIEMYPNEISERYFELRKDLLTKAHIMELFNNFKSLIPNETFAKENNRWNNIPGYDYSQIEEFLNTRIPLVDKVMEERRNS